MSVGALFEFVHRPFLTAGDIGMPAGMWAAQGVVEGDLSLGTRTLTHAFQVIPTSSNSNFYSLDQIYMSDVSLNDEAVIETTGLDVLFPKEGPTLSARFWRVALNSVVGTGPLLSVTSLGGSIVPKIFLGQPSRDPSLSALLIASIANNGADEDGFVCFLQGYFWSPGAMNTPGGLKRPIDGLYSG